jgi:mannosyltransferase OCH1-like enzyme
MIPKKIHHIWVGNTSIPDRFMSYIEMCYQLYTDYQFFLWDDKLVDDENIIPNDLKPYYNNNFPPAFKADILRYLIINKHGGLYFDTDFEPLKRIPDNFLNFDFLGAIQNNGEIAIGFFGANPHTTLLETVIKSIPDSIDFAKENAFFIPREIYRITGPYFFNKLAKEYIKENNYFFFTKEYFYPYWFGEKERENENFKITSPLSYAVHHWQSSWIH